MEDQIAFELKEAVRRWRENLAQSAAFRRENLNELESHLRDSVAALEARGFSAAEAFLVASRRLGQNQQLESEFGKLNRGDIWLGRALWMLIGIQLWPFFDRFMSGITGDLFALGSRGITHYTPGFAWPIFVSALMQLPAMIAAVWLSWAVVRKADKFGEWIATKLPRRSSFVLCCIAGCVLVFLSYAVLILLAMGLTKLSGGLAEASIVAHSRQFIAPLRVIGFVVVTLFLARRLLGFHKIVADQASFDREYLNELEPRLRDSVTTLQTRGLSIGEAFLIAMRHSGEGQRFEPEFGKINAKTKWLERALWMLIGIQVWPLFDGLMSGMAGNLFALGWSNVPHGSSAVGDAWPIFFSALIQLPAMIAAAWLFWRVLKNSGKLGQWLASKLPRRSSFVLCCLVTSVLALLSYALVDLLPIGWYKFSANPIRTPSFIADSRALIMLLRTIGFVILTLLLARKRLVREKA